MRRAAAVCPEEEGGETGGFARRVGCHRAVNDERTVRFQRGVNSSVPRLAEKRSAGRNAAWAETAIRPARCEATSKTSGESRQVTWTLGEVWAGAKLLMAQPEARSRRRSGFSSPMWNACGFPHLQTFWDAPCAVTFEPGVLNEVFVERVRLACADGIQNAFEQRGACGCMCLDERY